MHVRRSARRSASRRSRSSPCFEIEQAELEHLLRLLLDLLQVVQTLDAVAAFEPLLHVEDVAHELVIVLVRLDLELRRGLLDRAEGLHDEHGVMRDDRAPAFATMFGCGTFSSSQMSMML